MAHDSISRFRAPVWNLRRYGNVNCEGMRSYCCAVDDALADVSDDSWHNLVRGHETHNNKGPLSRRCRASNWGARTSYADGGLGDDS